MLKEELLRYSRHIMLPEIDIEGQEKINDMSLAFIGMGGLGCSASLYSALSGFGKIKIIDFDFVEASNLQRQILFDENDLSKSILRDKAPTFSVEVSSSSLPNLLVILDSSKV